VKVLIADGSALVVDRLLPMIQEIPLVELLVPAPHAKAALESVRRHDPDILILDARIPGAAGTALIKTIRQAKPSLILIVLTNLVDPEYLKRLEALGADLCLDKSREFTHLLKIVHELACSSFRGKESAAKEGKRKQLASSKLRTGLRLRLPSLAG
jgi:DNA-binding NarL/FixJ family response regulator